MTGILVDNKKMSEASFTRNFTHNNTHYINKKCYLIHISNQTLILYPFSKDLSERDAA